MRRILAILLTVITVLTSVDITVFAEEVQNLVSELSTSSTSGKCGDNLTWEITGSTLTISGTGAMYDYTNVYGNPDSPGMITGTSAPWSKCNLAALVIEEGVTSIGDRAFAMCTFAGNLILPETLKAIGDGAFGSASFSGGLTIPNSVTTIERGAFGYCKFSGGLKLSENLTVINERVFVSCSGLTGNLVIPDSVTIIGKEAFYECRGFNGNLYLGKNLTEIGTYAFLWCSKLSGDLIIPDKVQKIGMRAFANTGFTGRLHIPDSVTTIDRYAFNECKFTGQLVLPKNLSIIEYYAFYGCTGFTGDLVIPSSVKTIYQAAFYGCTGFDGELILNEGIEKIGAQAFQGCSNLTGDIVIPNSVEEISFNAFYDCTRLTGIAYIPETVMEIGDRAFHKIHSIKGFFDTEAETYAEKNGFAFVGEVSDRSKYEYFEGGISWSDAKKRCEELGGHLVVISSQEEQNYINSYVEKLRKSGELTKQNIWIGGTVKYGVVTWVTNEIGSYTNWSTGEPNNIHNMENCIMMYTSLSANGKLGYWNDETGDGRYDGYPLSDFGYICEWDSDFKKNTQYSIKLIDSISKRPLDEGKLTLGNGQTVEVSKKGKIIFNIGEDCDSEQTIAISAEGYKDYTGKLSQLSRYKRNTIEMEATNGFDSELFDFSNASFSNETINGPTINLFGKDIPLFTLDIGIDLFSKKISGKFNSFNYKINKEEKTIEIILGAKDGYGISNGKEWNEYYEKFKNYYKTYNNKNATRLELIRKYVEMQQVLDSFETIFVFETSATVGGYLELDYSSGEIKYKDGGLVFKAEAGAEADIPIPAPYGTFVYATYGLVGELEGKPTFKQNLMGRISLDSMKSSFEVKPYIEGGLKLLFEEVGCAGLGLEGQMKVDLNLPADKLSEAVKIAVSGIFYIRVNLRPLFLEHKQSYKFANCVWPKSETDAIAVLNIDNANCWSKIPRDYLYSVAPLTVVTDETDGISQLSQQNIYPYASTQLAQLEDEKLLAVWLKDDGTKTDNNRTTLYFSIYENDSWSSPSAICETGRADFAPELVVNGNTVHILWQRATKVFEDEYDIDTALANTELVYSKWENGVFSEPITISKNEGVCPLSYSIASENGTVVASWMENSENDYTLDSGTTSIYSRTYQNEAWGEVVTVKSDASNIDSYVNGFVNGAFTFAYTTTSSNSEENIYELYIGDSLIKSSNTEISALSYQNDRFYWIENGSICYYDNGQIIETKVPCTDSDYKVVCEDNVSCIVFRVDDGFVNELYISYEENNQYTNPVVLTNYGKHISQYDVATLDGNVLSFMAIDNLNENKDEFPYTTTDLICQAYEKRTDIAIDDHIIYDEESIRIGNTVTFKTKVNNLGTADIQNYTLNIVDEEGNILVTKNYSETLHVGDGQVVEIEYKIPNNFTKKLLQFIVSTENEAVAYTQTEETSNNELAITVGRADIEVSNCIVENNTIKGTIQNNGIVLADDIIVEISYFDGEKTVLKSLEIEDLEPGAVSEFAYELPKEYSTFEEYYLSNRFIISATSSSEESNYVNNECDVLIHPIHVESVSLDTTKVSLVPKKTVKLTATIQPLDALEQGVTWISDATDVATVDQNGVVTASASGTAIITAITQDGDFTASCKIVVSECKHEYSEEWTLDIEPTSTSNGMISRHCLHCDAYTEQKELEYLKFAGASLTLHDNLAINYKVNKAFFEENLYEKPYVKFNLNGVEKIVDTYTTTDDKYVFDFKDIAPNQMNDIITATLYATYNGVTYASEPVEYSVASYCYNMLDKYSTDEYAKLRTLLVDLLNYGADSQTYTDYSLGNLVNAKLTQEQIAWGTSETPTFTSVMNREYATIENPSVTWLGAGLNLKDSVTMRFKLSAENIEDLTVKLTSESGEWTIASDKFAQTDGGYYVYFNGFNAGQMSEPVYVTVYDGDKIVSNTICYSIESYAYAKKDADDEKLVNLLYSMMKYGNSAYAYVH